MMRLAMDLRAEQSVVELGSKLLWTLAEEEELRDLLHEHNALDVIMALLQVCPTRPTTLLLSVGHC